MYYLWCPKIIATWLCCSGASGHTAASVSIVYLWGWYGTFDPHEFLCFRHVHWCVHRSYFYGLCLSFHYRCHFRHCTYFHFPSDSLVYNRHCDYPSDIQIDPTNWCSHSGPFPKSFSIIPLPIVCSISINLLGIQVRNPMLRGSLRGVLTKIPHMIKW